MLSGAVTDGVIDVDDQIAMVQEVMGMVADVMVRYMHADDKAKASQQRPPTAAAAVSGLGAIMARVIQATAVSPSISSQNHGRTDEDRRRDAVAELARYLNLPPVAFDFEHGSPSTIEARAKRPSGCGGRLMIASVCSDK